MVSIVILVLIAVLVVAASHFMNVREDNHEKSKKAEVQTQKSSKILNKPKDISVAVISESFHSNFMTKDYTQGYGGVNIGDSKNTIESHYGTATELVNVNGNKADKYGDIAVSYDKDNKVNHVFIVSSHITVEEFKRFFNEPEQDNGHIWYYDSNKDNGFTIKVYTDGFYIKAIENIKQI